MRRTVITAALVACFQLHAGPGVAQGYQWQTQAFNDESNKGRYTAYLTLELPETDDRQFQAVCSPGSSATFATTVLGYDTGNIPEGRSVKVQFFARGQRVYQKTGEVYHGDGEEGVSGVLFRPEVNDRLWRVLSNGRNLKYRIRGRRSAAMPLAGSSKAIARFLDECRGIFGIGASDDSDNEENNVASARSCQKFGNTRSRNANTPVTIRFRNRTGGQRTVMWLDYKGQPVEYKILGAGESYSQKTFVGHPWMFVDGPGNCKELFIPTRQSRTYDITFDR